MLNQERYNDIKAASAFIDGEAVFATYASAQETVEGIFQPSGADYIIHVLGDQMRKNYLDAFSAKNFKYAVTIRPDFTCWEYWVRRANWFFYRELFRNWHKVFENSYAAYWERNLPGSQNVVSGDFDVEIIDVDASTKKLCIRTDKISSGTADVFLDWTVEKKDTIRARLLARTLLSVQDPTESDKDIAWFKSNYLRSQSREYIPVTISEGYGEVLLTSKPERDTYLKINSVSCKAVYTIPLN
ncbi:MAG: hypothetical protein IJR85_03505 [Synergistaceae bacterium]|nr:hypothetical protein [Synergistaceae bacterium]